MPDNKEITVETDLTEKEKAVIAQGCKDYKKGDFISLDTLEELEYKQELRKIILKGIEQADNGQVKPMDEVFDQLEKKISDQS